jgi:hypothetical protein
VTVNKYIKDEINPPNNLPLSDPENVSLKVIKIPIVMSENVLDKNNVDEGEFDDIKKIKSNNLINFL